MNDDLGKRMKENYESRTKFLLPRRSYSILRLDGKAFHSYTKNCKRPYDEDLAEAMDCSALFLCKEIQGAKLAYVQSDEISILLTDFDNLQTEPYFGGNIQKIVSVVASLCTGVFNDLRFDQGITQAAAFDCRILNIPDPIEVYNYFVWRQKDAIRNSISMLAQSHFSHKELHKLNVKQIQEKLINKKDINWSKMPNEFKNGRLISKQPNWEIKAAPVFTQSYELTNLIPLYKDCE